MIIKILQRNYTLDLVEKLKHDRQNIRMSFVNFIEQDDGIWTRLQLLRQLSTLVVSNVSGR